MGNFIDFDKKKNLFYNNVYLDDEKIVVKIPLCSLLNSSKKDFKKEKKKVKIEKFDLTKYVYLTAI